MQNFSARETEWLLELDGVELASFWRRAGAFLLDVVLSYLSIMLLAGVKGTLLLLLHLLTGLRMPEHAFGIDMPHHEEHGIERMLPGTFFTVLYFGLLTWRGKGRSPGKKFMGIRIVSLVHRHLSLWHAIERSLGYFAALLEGGFGFFQYFIHPYHRTIQDRIAETIVVTERGYQAMQHKLSHPLLPDAGDIAETHIADETLTPIPELPALEP